VGVRMKRWTTAATCGCSSMGSVMCIVPRSALKQHLSHPGHNYFLTHANADPKYKHQPRCPNNFPLRHCKTRRIKQPRHSLGRLDVAITRVGGLGV